MTEFELKLEIPAASVASVVASMRKGKTMRQRLQAKYFDTAEGLLARHGIVVRVRKEGRRWVQTAKGPTSGPLERLEHNVALAALAPGSVHQVDLARHAATPVGQAIEAALGLKAGEAFPVLHQLYETDVWRTSRTVERAGSVVELALDQGRVMAGAHVLELCELEVELKSGHPEDAAALARQWCARHGLWLSTISKSMKGQRLRSGQASSPAVGAVAPDYQRQTTAAQLASAVLQSCLSQIMPNASEVASGSCDPDHIHQLRVGIRRMRTALREINGLAEGMDPAWQATLVDVFRALGRQRDHEHLTHQLQPLLQASGGPALNPGPADTDRSELKALVRSPAFQDVLLGLTGFAHHTERTLPEKHSPTVVKVKKDLRLRLQKLHSQALKDGKKFLSLNETRQHGVRKRLKRLRYLAEFSAPLFSGRAVRAFLAALKPAQDALGLYNDELMAARAYRALAESNALAWFGVGWLTARHLPSARRCLKKVKNFARVKPFWD